MIRPRPPRQRSRRTRLAALVALAVAVVVGSAGLTLPAQAATTIATDGFDRTAGSGWGSAPTGGAWTVLGGSGSSVGSGNGVVSGVTGGRSFRAYLGSTSVADATVQASFVVPTTGEVYLNTEARRQPSGSAYRGRVRIAADRRLHAEAIRYTGSGTGDILAAVTLPGVAAAGQAVTVKLSVSGTNPVSVRTKAYLTGTAEPGWQAVYDDTAATRIAASGAVGVGGDNATGNPAVTMTTQSMTATGEEGAAAPPPTEVPSDTPTGTAGRGSAPVGSTSYPVPSGAVFVATNGNDGNAGTSGAPLKTVTKAISKVAAGGTIVMRGGTYREYFIVPPAKKLTLQSYPNEAVWLDGTSPVSGFVRSGNVWKAPWAVKFDSSPTYTKGAPDSTAPGWQFVNPAYPMAAHPDAVWLNNVEQTQVGSLAGVTAGKFYVDGTSLYLGSDPSGKSVRASDLAQAMSLRAPGTVIRGIGVRRYGSSVWMQGVISSYYPGQTLENVVVADAGTGGVGFYGANSTLRNVTIEGSGQMGFSASKADGLLLDNVVVRNSNDQKFNPAPAAGAIKITTTRGVTVKNSLIENTFGNGLWFDESAYDVTAVNNLIRDGDRYGLILEISSTATVADNVIANNAYDGIMIQNTDKVNVWNNTLVGNGRNPILICQDTRRITNLSLSGHDNRRPQPDMSMPWVVGSISVGNNIMSASGSSPAVLNAQAYDKSWSASAVISSNGNVLAQPAAGAPSAAVIWGQKGANPTRYATVSAYAAGTGQDRASYALVGNPVGSGYAATAAVVSRQAAVAQGLPSAVAAKVGRPAGTKQLGAWVN